ncbi:MAG: TrmH family RNA methyltransferase [Candidatus Nanopelagicus sp.]
MENITSLNSPHIERVKALIGSRGKKNRELENAFIAEGIQAVREALNSKLIEGLAVKKVYVTESGLNKLLASVDRQVVDKHECFLVSDQVMNAMADSESPQGVLALCSTKSLKLADLWKLKPKKIAFFWQIQDPGNAGTVIRSADAAGFDAVVFSTESVDVFNPKTVRATVGSLWHVPVVSDVDIDEFIIDAIKNDVSLFALTGDGKELFNQTLLSKASATPSAWIFGNEARGLPDLPSEIATVAIPMKGFAESLNVASAAAIVLHSVGLSL